MMFKFGFWSGEMMLIEPYLSYNFLSSFNFAELGDKDF
jgi:hypothetical protein